MGALRPSGGANAVAGCWPTPEEHIPSGSDRVRVGLIATAITVLLEIRQVSGVKFQRQGHNRQRSHSVKETFMANQARHPKLVFRLSRSSMLGAALTLATLGTLAMVAMQPAQAQTFTVLHNFTGGADGESPYVGVTIAPSGVLYGTTRLGGTHGIGTAFRLTPEGSGWVFSPLYEFTGGLDGEQPVGGIAIGPNGVLYGTTPYAGINDGVVFALRPAATFCKSTLCYWSEAVLHAFPGSPDGAYPQYENLTFDQAGNIYGTTCEGGIYGAPYGGGITFQLTPSGTGRMESILHNFGSGSDGWCPSGGVVLDTAGNVYGSTRYGGPGGDGALYQLMPSNGGWVENILVNFDGANGANPYGNLIIDNSGNLYGATSSGGQNGGGVVFKLAPSDGGWSYSAIYSFSSCSPFGGVAMDAAGDLFGTCNTGGAGGYGWVYELTNCSQTCIPNDLHDFSGSDGAGPLGAPVLDANGNLYGTTAVGGTGNCGGYGCGVVWEITP